MKLQELFGYFMIWEMFTRFDQKIEKPEKKKSIILCRAVRSKMSQYVRIFQLIGSFRFLNTIYK